MAHDHAVHGRHAHAPGGPGRLAPAEAARHTRGVTRLSVVAALFLCAIKLAAWLASGSVSLLASLADSGLDLVASLLTFAAVRYAATPADAEHRFGHGKAEAFAALFQAGLVAVSAALVAREAMGRLIAPAPISHGGWGLLVMAVSMAVTAGLITAQTRALRATGSVAVAGDRAHYAADLAANLAVIVGLAAAWLLGSSAADAVMGGLVAAWLLWGAWGVARGALDQMMDRELPDAERARIKALAADDRRVLGVHQLRTRASGPLVHMQMHVDLDPAITLREAHDIMVAMEERILAAYPGADVLIHPDPHGHAEPHGNPHLASSERASRG